jgi:hypothetical protein
MSVHGGRGQLKYRFVDLNMMETQSSKQRSTQQQSCSSSNKLALNVAGWDR